LAAGLKVPGDSLAELGADDLLGLLLSRFHLGRRAGNPLSEGKKANFPLFRPKKGLHRGRGRTQHERRPFFGSLLQDFPRVIVGGAFLLIAGLALLI
jgi:hypothetical protein